MVVHRKDTAEYFFRVKKLCIFYERPFLHKIFLKFVPIGSKKRQEKNLKNKKETFSLNCLFHLKLY